MEAKIRPACREDVPFIAWVALQAARSHLPRGLWDILLDRPERECLGYLEKLAQTPTKTFFHFSRFIVTELEGRPVAGLCGYEAGESGFEVLAAAALEAIRLNGWSDSELSAMVERIVPLRRCEPDTCPGAWIVENVATLPDFRRRGLVNQLLGTMLATGRKLGHRYAQISVLIGNTPAQKAYEKVGFRVIDEKRDPEFHRVMGEPGTRRLLMEL